MTKEQLEIVIKALEMYKAFAVYGEGRDKHQAAVQEVIEVLQIGQPVYVNNKGETVYCKD